MKTLYFKDKSYSWLQFPVTLKGLDPSHDPHLTLKFFGEAHLDAEVIGDRLASPLQDELNKAVAKDEIGWQPDMWTSPIQHSVHFVLALTTYPSILKFYHNAFSIIRDQHTPWRPHITVPKEYFLMVEDQGFTPRECELTFSEIELCLGGPHI